MNQKEIAGMLGVSEATVSLVLNDSPKVNKETRNRVRKVLDATGFQPSEIARSLAMKKTWTIGIIIPAFSSHFYAEFVEEIHKSLSEKGYIALTLAPETPEEVEGIIMTFLRRRVDGVISAEIGHADIALLRNKQLPFVLYHGVSDKSVDYVSTDRYKGSYLLTEHLIKLGRKDIGFLGYRTDEEKRFAGYRDCLHAHRILLTREWVVPGRGLYLNGYEAAEKLLSLRRLPQAVMALNDTMAIGAMRAIREHGLRIPQDMAVVGFDNVEEGEYSCPPLTTVSQPRSEIARRLVDILLMRIENKNGVPAQRIDLEPELVIRESCGARDKKRRQS